MLFKRSLLCLTISAALPFYACAENITPAKDLPDNEEEVEFNDQFLLNGSANIDINRFSHGNPVLPGTYRTKINLNGKLKSTVEVTFKDNGTPRATPCITKLLLSQSGVDTSTLPDGPEDDESCVDIKKSFAGATVREGANKRGNSSRLTQSFHFFMFEPIF
ncbi:FimD/PapC N-terminal domain-containing protein, partial [Enterobacter hormaechei]